MNLFTIFVFSLQSVAFGYKNIKLDVLSPFSNVGDEEQLQKHRVARDCKNILHGRLQHESIYPIRKSLSYNLNYFHLKTVKGDTFGHYTIVKDPLKLISVLEPLHPGGCAERSLASVVESAKQANCQIAMNAGFFEPNKKDHGACLGNIISNGKLVKDSGGIHNPNFGILKNGSVIIGYLSDDEVRSSKNQFYQLIMGVGWVLRNGDIYLKESAGAECRELETSGSLKHFFELSSARTLIGYDNFGHVHLVQFDGKTDVSGVNLYEAATYMKSQGVINAINLDGGGSATYVANSTVLNYPGNECTDEDNHKLLCPRNVSTIICVHNTNSNKDISSYKVSAEDFRYDANRNYGIVILLTVIIGILMLCNVFLCNYYLLYRARVKFLSSSSQKKEALQSLLASQHSSEPDSETDGL